MPIIFFATMLMIVVSHVALRIFKITIYFIDGWLSAFFRGSCLFIIEDFFFLGQTLIPVFF